METTQTYVLFGYLAPIMGSQNTKFYQIFFNHTALFSAVVVWQPWMQGI